MIADYLADNWTNPSETLFRGVWRVPAAHALQCDRGRAAPRIWRYWDVQAGPTIAYRTEDEYVEHFSDLLRQAVRSRLRTAKRVGVLLSGGLDSSAVAYSASGIIGKAPTIGQEQLDTFTAVYDEFPDIDERRYVDPFVARCGSRPHYVLADELWTLRYDAPRLGAWDEPFENAFDNLIRGMLARAKQENVDVLLTGGYGDELVEGNLYYLHDLLMARRWTTLVHELAHWPWWRRADIAQRYAVAPLWVRPVKPMHEVGVPSWVRPHFAARTDMKARFRTAYAPQRFSRPSQQVDFASVTYFSRLPVTLWLQAEGLRHEVDLRHPYLDSRLIDFLMRIPSWHKRRDPATKGLLRSMLRSSVPSVLTERPVTGPPGEHAKLFAKGLRHRERYRWEACFAGNSRLAELGAIDPTSLRRAFGQYLRGDDSLGFPLACVFRLEIWLKQQC
jgi:asparagine synthase (glutamine-hydrolysing)